MIVSVHVIIYKISEHWNWMSRLCLFSISLWWTPLHHNILRDLTFNFGRVSHGQWTIADTRTKDELMYSCSVVQAGFASWNKWTSVKQPKHVLKILKSNNCLSSILDIVLVTLYALLSRSDSKDLPDVVEKSTTYHDIINDKSIWHMIPSWNM